MPLLVFKKQFSLMVEKGTKNQTIRAKRVDGRNPHAGETLFLYAGLRTKGCEKLKEVICKNVEEITIDPFGICIAGRWLSIKDGENIAMDEGFDDFTEMKTFFKKVYDLPFCGLLIKW